MDELLFVAVTVCVLALPMVASRYGYAVLNACAIFLVMTTTIISGHIVSLFGHAASAGVTLFAAIFLTTDLISEIHGKEKAFSTVIQSFCANLLLLSIGYVLIHVAAIRPGPVSDALMTLFTFIPRLLLGGLLAYFISQSIDVYIFHLYKKWTGGRFLWLRNIGSTIVSQAVDSALVVTIAFYGVLPELWGLFLTTYVVKVIVAVLDTPFCYLGRYLSRQTN